MIPRRLKIVAIITAILGRSTLVETTVAMAFGASVQPFTKIDPQTSKSATISTKDILFLISWINADFVIILYVVQNDYSRREEYYK